MKTEVASCGSCQFRRDDFCCRLPPTVTFGAADKVLFGFPIVNSDWWCGEWKFGSGLASTNEGENV